ncbi:hypothetical protein M0811_06404 [Anaeramoeba ignava]|uniref:Uncharacterized protein n=1 Tax=Anaeramoeba ignava TaxID=1746090 RepID=A0A9Q0RDS2_ANAIG|nr:hypothetical protein M0811_06404 [Anaeramoeba ignava]
MNLDFGFLFIIIIIIFEIKLTMSCASNLDCSSKGHPVCDIGSGICVECQANSDCEIDSYCDGTQVPAKCREYKKDTKFGQFCNSQDCAYANSSVVCGRCDTNATWTGVCLRFVCHACSIQTPGSGILKDHPDAMCYPKGISGADGYLGPAQIAGQTPRFTKQDARSIGWIIVGFLAGSFLIMQCLTFKKISDRI